MVARTRFEGHWRPGEGIWREAECCRNPLEMRQAREWHALINILKKIILAVVWAKSKAKRSERKLL